MANKLVVCSAYSTSLLSAYTLCMHAEQAQQPMFTHDGSDCNMSIVQQYTSTVLYQAMGPMVARCSLYAGKYSTSRTSFMTSAD